MADYNVSAEEANLAKVCDRDINDVNIRSVKILCGDAKNKGHLYFSGIL